MEMEQPHLIPDVEWVPCARGLPTKGIFVWVVVGRVISAGNARRYEREVHMAIRSDDLVFQIFPYKTPICSTKVWAWAVMTPPDAPVCKTTGQANYDGQEGDEYIDDPLTGEEWKDETED